MPSLIGPVRSYAEMLGRITTCTAIVALVLALVMRSQLGWFDDLLKPIDSGFDLIPPDWRKVPAGDAVVLVLAAVGSRFFKLHDRLSDLLQIRARFDVDAILRPMALMTLQSPMTRAAMAALSTQRDDLMHALFYPYASTDPARRQIDAHYVDIAIDHWTWYWVVLEGNFLCLVAALVFLFSSSYGGAAVLLLLVLVLIGLLQLLRRMCERNALNEVEEILKDSNRAQAIQERLSAL